MIRMEGVAKSYGPIEALRGVDLEVADGETLGVVGPNGAGKTTLLKVLLGLVHPDNGSVSVDGVSLSGDPVTLRRRIGYVPQHDGFDDRATGRSALTFLTRLRGLSVADVTRHARAAGVDHLLDRRVDTLSGGQRQRLSVASALLGDPPVLLLDEPTASLDPRATASFRRLVQKMSGQGRTIVLCSHLLDDVERLCDRVLVLLDGRVAAVEVMDPGEKNVAGGLEKRFLAHVGGEDEDHEN
ncbi:ABC transporter ATP-binding protein [bacterium]|nr:ABC transporter ATP-binding protein [bacterium]